jgi:hypothetical protein
MGTSRLKCKEPNVLHMSDNDNLNINSNIKKMRHCLRKKDIKSMENLLKNGFSANIVLSTSGSGVPPLFNFINTVSSDKMRIVDKLDVKIVNLLIKYNADVNYHDLMNDMNILSLMCNSNKENTKESLTIIKSLLDNKANITSSSMNRALRKCNGEVVKLLVEHKGEIDNNMITEFKGKLFSPLAHQTIKILFDNAQDKLIKYFGDSLIVHCCNLGCYTGVKYLLGHHIDNAYIDKSYTNITPYILNYCECLNYHVEGSIRINGVVKEVYYNRQYDLTLSQLTVLNINTLIPFDHKKILIDDYIKVISILVENGANFREIELNYVIKSNFDNIKKELNALLTIFFPNVLVNIINDYYNWY